MDYSEEKGLIMVRLHQDEDFFESIKHVCMACEVRTGIFLSGIGMLKQAELSFFVKNGRYATAVFPEPLELLARASSRSMTSEKTPSGEAVR